MATYRAPEAATTGVVRLLAGAFDRAAFPDVQSPPRLVGADDPTHGLTSGVGVLAYAVEVSRLSMNAGELPDRTGASGPNALPVEVRLLVLARAQDPGTRLALAGWVLSTLADSPVMPADLLNGEGQDRVFGDHESVALRADTLTTGDLLQRVEVFVGDSSDVLALPYVLSGIDIVADRAGVS
jgi:hypothetical protein